ARRIPKTRGDLVQAMNLPGIFVEVDVARRYPSGTVASQVLGFVDVEGHGQARIEHQYRARTPPAPPRAPAVARRYPSGTVASQVLGFVDVEGHGQAGIEQQYDGLLRGHPGKIQLERDPRGRTIPPGRRSVWRAEPGTDLVLTTDQQLQYVTEQALGRAVRDHKAKAGSVVVMSPRTGEILAMANGRPFAPTKAGRGRPEG